MGENSQAQSSHAFGTSLYPMAGIAIDPLPTKNAVMEIAQLPCRQTSIPGTREAKHSVIEMP